MTDGPVKLSMALAEDGATPEALKATEIVVLLLNGFPPYLALSVLANASAMVICHVEKSEVRAVDTSRMLHREITRCIRKNHQHFKREESQ